MISYFLSAGNAKTFLGSLPQRAVSLLRSSKPPFFQSLPFELRVFFRVCVAVRVRNASVRQRVEGILNLAGAFLVTKPPLSSTAKYPTYLVTDRTAIPMEFRRRSNRGEVVAVTWEWLVECILLHRIVEPDRHETFQPQQA